LLRHLQQLSARHCSARTAIALQTGAAASNASAASDARSINGGTRRQLHQSIARTCSATKVSGARAASPSVSGRSALTGAATGEASTGASPDQQ